MSLNNDYWTKIVTDQRVHELHAQAAQDRLARLVVQGQQTWWQRVRGLRLMGGRQAKSGRLRSPSVAR